MEKLLQEKNCYLRDRVQDWKEAVHIACEPLIEQNYCTTAYEDAIYEITEKLGPYYVPVSYTHLDVYKRQALICSWICLVQIIMDTFPG